MKCFCVISNTFICKIFNCISEVESVDLGERGQRCRGLDVASLMLSCVHPNLFVLFKKLFGVAPPPGDSEADMYNNLSPQWPFVRQRHPAEVQGANHKVRAERITIEGDVLR